MYETSERGWGRGRTIVGALALAWSWVSAGACAGAGDDNPTTSAFDPTMPTNTSTGMEDTGPPGGPGPGPTTASTQNGSSGGPPGTGCCSPSPEAGCDNPETETCVCTIEPTCCQSVWTQACADLASDPCNDPACAMPPMTSTTNPSDTTTDGPPTMTCAELAAMEGWVNEPRCQVAGGSQCNGMGTPTVDCDFCCPVCEEMGDQSCGDLAEAGGWPPGSAQCEWNGNGACGGSGMATCDCDHCCQI